MDLSRAYDYLSNYLLVAKLEDCGTDKKKVIFNAVLTAQKMMFPLRIFSVNVIKSAVPADLVIFTGKILNPLSANPTVWSNTIKQFVG